MLEGIKQTIQGLIPDELRKSKEKADVQIRMDIGIECVKKGLVRHYDTDNFEQALVKLYSDPEITVGEFARFYYDVFMLTGHKRLAGQLLCGSIRIQHILENADEVKEKLSKTVESAQNKLALIDKLQQDSTVVVEETETE